MSSCTPYQWANGAPHTQGGCLPSLVWSPALAPPSKTPQSAVIHILRPPLKPIFRIAAKSHGGDAPQVYFILTHLPNSQNLQETQKFRAEHFRRLLKEKETFGPDLHRVIGVCAEVISDFLQKEYGGPEPCTDILVALKEKELPGAPLAARTSPLWVQIYLDRDWESGTRNRKNDVSFVIKNSVNLI